MNNVVPEAEEEVNFDIVGQIVIDNDVNNHIQNDTRIPMNLRRSVMKVHDFILTSMAQKRQFMEKIPQLRRRASTEAHFEALDSLQKELEKDHLGDLKSSAELIDFEAISGHVGVLNAGAFQKVIRSVTGLVHVVMQLNSRFQLQIEDLEGSIRNVEDFDCLFSVMKQSTDPQVQKIVERFTKMREEKRKRAEEEKAKIILEKQQGTDKEEPKKEKLRRTYKRNIVKAKNGFCLVNHKSCRK